VGGGAPGDFKEGVAKLEAAWRAAGREGEPRKLTVAYFALGEGAEQAADRYRRRYYAWLGDVAD
jgi:hypothetical protein